MPSNSQSSFSALTITLTVLVSLLCGVLRAQQETHQYGQSDRQRAEGGLGIGWHLGRSEVNTIG
ncbi:MAG: hypothetical protein ACKOAH_25075, partial [Pirellula sp.]